MITKKLLSALVALGLLSMMYGMIDDGHPAPVSAACQTPSGCGLDPSSLAILDVDHQTTGGNAVLPDTGETWYINAVWSTDSLAGFPCMCVDTNTANVTATATYSTTAGWLVSCTGCNASTGPIKSVSICEVGQGCDNPAGKLGYKILVDINHTFANACGMNPGTLNRVTFTTTSVDDGNEKDETDCSIGASVSPTSQTWSTTDSGGFECSGDCSTAGASITIYYN